MRCSHDAHPGCQILFCGPVNGMADQLLTQQQAACWWPRLLVLGSRGSDPGFYKFSGKSSLKLNHRGGLGLLAETGTPVAVW